MDDFKPQEGRPEDWPFNLPTLIQKRVTRDEFMGQLNSLLAARLHRTSIEPIEYRVMPSEDVLELKAGSGYYKVPQDADRDKGLWPGIPYLALHVLNIQILVTIDPRGHTLLTRGRQDETSPWSGWYYWYDSNGDLPIDRFHLTSELARHV